MNTAILFFLLIALMLTGMPISISLGLTVLTFLFAFTQVPIESVALKLFTGIEEFELMAHRNGSTWSRVVLGWPALLAACTTSAHVPASAVFSTGDHITGLAPRYSWPLVANFISSLTMVASASKSIVR